MKPFDQELSSAIQNPTETNESRLKAACEPLKTGRFPSTIRAFFLAFRPEMNQDKLNYQIKNGGFPELKNQFIMTIAQVFAIENQLVLGELELATIITTITPHFSDEALVSIFSTDR